MTPEEEATITKAMLLGCPFYAAPNGMWYAHLGAMHPMMVAKKKRSTVYGYGSALELATDWVAYFERSRVAQ
jgi:hypothetical protein